MGEGKAPPPREDVSTAARAEEEAERRVHLVCVAGYCSTQDGSTHATHVKIRDSVASQSRAHTAHGLQTLSATYRIIVAKKPV